MFWSFHALSIVIDARIDPNRDGASHIEKLGESVFQG